MHWLYENCIAWTMMGNVLVNEYSRQHNSEQQCQKKLYRNTQQNLSEIPRVKNHLILKQYKTIGELSGKIPM